MVNFPTHNPDCDSHSLAVLDFFSDASICSTMAFPPLESSDHVSVSIDFPSNSHGDTPFRDASSPWFSAACAIAVVHRNHFFRLY